MNPEITSVQPPVIPQRDVAPPIRPRLPRRDRANQPGLDMLEADEELVTTIKRHPIGIFGLYFEVFIGIVLVVATLVFIAKVLADGEHSGEVIVAGTVFAIAILVFFLFVSTYVYRQCRILVTDRSLVQILQRSLFSRKVSRLSLSNVEDVSAESHGILASLFGYGTLRVQTAGTLENFEFQYCPNPTFYADQIIEARQRYVVQEEQQQMTAASMALRNQ